MYQAYKQIDIYTISSSLDIPKLTSELLLRIHQCRSKLFGVFTIHIRFPDKFIDYALHLCGVVQSTSGDEAEDGFVNL